MDKTSLEELLRRSWDTETELFQGGVHWPNGDSCINRFSAWVGLNTALSLDCGPLYNIGMSDLRGALVELAGITLPRKWEETIFNVYFYYFIMLLADISRDG